MERELHTLDLYMEDRFLFPNAYMEEAETLPQLRGRVYDLYFILRGDRYEIGECRGCGHVLRVCVWNATRKGCCWALLDVRSSFYVPDASCIQAERRDHNTLLQITYNAKGLRYLREREPELYRDYAARGFSCTFHARNLFELQMAADHRDFCQEYEVLYIGQSKKENIFQRLENHATLQRIMRGAMRDGEERELYVLVHSVGTKYLLKCPCGDGLPGLLLGNTLNRTLQIDEEVDHDALIDLAEALLIQHFQPPYNERLKKSSGLERLATYRRIGRSVIDTVTFSLDLGWCTGEKMILYTQAARTATKARIVECSFAHGTSVRYEDLPDAFY